MITRPTAVAATEHLFVTAIPAEDVEQMQIVLGASASQTIAEYLPSLCVVPEACSSTLEHNDVTTAIRTIRARVQTTTAYK